MRTTYKGRPIPNWIGIIVVSLAGPFIFLAFAVLVLVSPFQKLYTQLRGTQHNSAGDRRDVDN